MFGLSKAWLFGIGTAVAVAVVALLAWRALDTPIAPGAKPGSSALNLSQGDIAKADAVKAEAMKAEAAKQDAAKLDASKSDATKSDAAKSDAAKAGTDNRTADGKSDGKSDGKGPTFDIVRVEPSGETVVAGRGAPDVSIKLLDRGNVIAETKSDANGQFALVPPALGKGDHLLSLQAGGQGPGAGDPSVAVAVPQQGQGDVVVALAEPGAATKILSQPKAPTPDTPRDLAIRTVEAEEAGGFYATGVAMPGATVQLYLNGAVVATVRAGEGGNWSLKISRGMAPGAYAVRADQIGGDGKVVARAEVPFDYPVNRQVASADPKVGVSAAPGPDAVIGELQTVKVLPGDSLWRISRKMLGSGMRYTQIYSANTKQIRDPSLIYPDQVFVVPAER